MTAGHVQRFEIMVVGKGDVLGYISSMYFV